MELSLTQPDDWHLHVRDGREMRCVVPHTAACFRRAIIMPNLTPPITTVEQALQYRERILDATRGTAFAPLMTLYLTPNTSVTEIEKAAASPHVYAVKLYPAGATTNSAAGVTTLEPLQPVLQAMADLDLPLLVHGEVTDPTCDVFERETRFIEDTLTTLLDQFPTLRVVLEHITTEHAVDFVFSARSGVAATITAHHLLFNRNAIFRGGIRPDYYCLPILKRERDRLALMRAATSGNPRFFLGTDSAPHSAASKHNACGCAGIYTAHAALPLYAAAFESVGALDRLEGFASHFGADYYGLPRNDSTVNLRRDPWTVPHRYDFGSDELTPLLAGQQLDWKLV